MPPAQAKGAGQAPPGAEIPENATEAMHDEVDEDGDWMCPDEIRESIFAYLQNATTINPGLLATVKSWSIPQILDSQLLGLALLDFLPLAGTLK